MKTPNIVSLSKKLNVASEGRNFREVDGRLYV